MGMVNKKELSKHLSYEGGIKAFVDSRTLFNVSTKIGNTSDSRLKLEMLALKKSYEKKEFWRIGIVLSREKTAEMLTKKIGFPKYNNMGALKKYFVELSSGKISCQFQIRCKRRRWRIDRTSEREETDQNLHFLKVQ